MPSRSVVHFSSSRAACFTLCCEMPANVAHSRHSALANSMGVKGGGGDKHVRRI